MTQHRVRQGESISTIAQRFGLLPDTVWLDGANDELRRVRADPNILEPGDIVEARDKETKTETAETGRETTFVRKAVPDLLTLRFIDAEGEPRPGLEYRLDFGRKAYEGATDSDGVLEHPIVPGVRRARLVIDGERHEIQLSHLDPDDSVTGLQARLANLGLECGDVDGDPGERTQLAILEFQRRQGLEETGEFDDATRQALTDLYQS